MKQSIRIMGIRIDKVTLDLAVERVHSYLMGNQTNVIYTPNTEIVMAANKDKELKNILNQGDLVIPDGIGLIYASKIKKRNLPERVTGFDLSVKILELANKEGYSIFLLGGKEGVAKEAAEKISKEFPNVNIKGSYHGYFKGAHIGLPGHEEENMVIEKINNSGADILFVGFGAPRQEKWIHLNKNRIKCKIIIGNGGTIDVLAGRVKRAPLIYQKLGLEWFYRLVKEPWRIKRQIVLPIFMLKVLFSRNNIVD